MQDDENNGPAEGQDDEALLGGPVEDKAAKAVDDYLRSHEARIYEAVIGEASKYLPDPAKPLKELVDTVRATLVELGVGTSSEDVAKQLAAILPGEIVKPLVEIHRLVAPRLEWAMTEILDKASPAIDQLRDAVLAPIEAKLREIFHDLFTTVTRKAAQVIGKLVEAAVLKVLEAVKAVLARLIAAVMVAVAKAVAMAIQAMLEIVNAIGRAVFRFAKAVAMWIARKIAMFVAKTILKIFAFLFGIPGAQVDLAWMETESMIRI